MDIASTLSSALPGGTTGTGNTAASKATTDYNSFLTLLTAQLKFQDPLAPLDATQFISQLSQFSSVEAQCLMMPPTLSSLADGVARSCSSVRPWAVNRTTYRIWAR